MCFLPAAGVGLVGALSLHARLCRPAGRSQAMCVAPIRAEFSILVAGWRGVNGSGPVVVVYFRFLHLSPCTGKHAILAAWPNAPAIRISWHGRSSKRPPGRLR